MRLTVTHLRWLALAALVSSAAPASSAALRKPMSEGQIEAALDPRDPLDQPILLARQRVEATPASASARVDLGIAYMERGWAAEALRELREATSLAPDSSQVWNNLGILQNRVGWRGKAMRSFRKAVKLDPLNAFALYNLAVLLEEAGKVDGAIETFSQAFRLEPGLGEPDQNPRPRSQLQMLAKLKLYQESVGGGTLDPMRIPVPPGEAPARPRVMAPAPAPSAEPTPAPQVPKEPAPEPPEETPPAQEVPPASATPHASGDSPPA